MMVLLSSPQRLHYWENSLKRNICNSNEQDNKDCSYDEINYESEAISFKDQQVNVNYILIHNHHFNHLNSTQLLVLQSSSPILESILYYLDSHLHHVDTLPRSECSTYIASYGLNELTIYTSGLICTIRVWLCHMSIRVWQTYVPQVIIKKIKNLKRKQGSQ